jgi:hypothetical protein
MPAEEDSSTATVAYLTDVAHLANDPADEIGQPVHAFDAAGAHLDCFPTARLAHQWAHDQATRPDLPLPIELEDRARGWTRQVWPTYCRLLLWPPPIVLPLSGYRRGSTVSSRLGFGEPS